MGALLTSPLTVTCTLPDVAPLGTGTTICVSLQLAGVARVPLNFTVLVPCVAPKFVPVIVTTVPTGPEVGDKVVMLGPAARVSIANTDKEKTARTRIRDTFQIPACMNVRPPLT